MSSKFTFPFLDLPRKTRDLYEKSMAALERGNVGYAQDMLKQVIAMEPRFLLARKNLRIAQVKTLLEKKPTAMTHQLSSLKGMFTLMGARGKLNKDPKAALEAAETLLAMDPLNLSFLKALLKTMHVRTYTFHQMENSFMAPIGFMTPL